MEAGLQKIYDGILALMDKDLIPSASARESRVLYVSLQGGGRLLPLPCRSDGEDYRSREAHATASVERDCGCARSRDSGKMFDAPWGQVAEEPLGVASIIPPESFSERVEQMVDVLVPGVEGEIVEVVKLIQQECIHQRTVEEVADVSVPETQEENVDVHFL